MSLHCPICLSEFRDPRLLTCSHTFCFECISTLADKNPAIHCPLCREEVTLPPSGVSSLKKNIYIGPLMETMTKVNRISEAGQKCSLHPTRILEFFCDGPHCKKPVCASCVVTTHQGADHVLKEMPEEVIMEVKKQAATLMEVTQMAALIERIQRFPAALREPLELLIQHCPSCDGHCAAGSCCQTKQTTAERLTQALEELLPQQPARLTFTQPLESHKRTQRWEALRKLGANLIATNSPPVLPLSARLALTAAIYANTSPGDPPTFQLNDGAMSIYLLFFRPGPGGGLVSSKTAPDGLAKGMLDTPFFHSDLEFSAQDIVFFTFLHEVNQVSCHSQELIRRVLPRFHPPPHRISVQRNQLKNSIPITATPASARRSGRAVVNRLLASPIYREAAAQMAPNEPLIVDLYFDAGEKTQTAGFQMFGLRMELEAAFIKADSVDTVFPIGLTNSVLEEGRMSDWEYLEELAPCAEDLLQLRTEGVTVPENGAHHVQFNLIADLGHSHLLKGMGPPTDPGAFCGHCTATAREIHENTSHVRDFPMNRRLFRTMEELRDAVARGDATARGVQRPAMDWVGRLVGFDMRRFVDDPLHIDLNVMRALFAPALERASNDQAFRATFEQTVSAQNRITFHLSRGAGGGPRRFPKHINRSLLRKIFSRFDPAVLVPLHLHDVIRRLWDLVDEMLNSLHVPLEDPAHLSRDQFTQHARDADILFRQVYTQDSLTSYLHLLFHHMPDLLEINQTYHRFSMQSFEAGIGSNRRCFFSRTTHGAALPYAPSAFVQMLQSANVLLASKENERFLLAKEARAYHHHKRSKTTASFSSRKTVAQADHSESSDEEDGEPV